MLHTANQISPFDGVAMIEPEAPVRRHALRNRRIGRLAFIHRRQSAREQDLAADVELFGGFVTGIDAPCRLGFVEIGLLQREPRRLTFFAIDGKAEPPPVGANRPDNILFRPPKIRVIHAQL